jgi:phage repressor protein C with HTH and peptisase S24 domain
MMSIGSNIRTYRKARGYTLNQLAAQVESDVGNLSRLERDQQGYSDAILQKLSLALNVPVAAFFDPDMVSINSAGDITVIQVKEAVGPYQGVHAAEKDDPGFVQVPMVRLRLQAGVTGFQTEPERRDGGTVGMRRSWIERAGLNPAHLVAILVKGESMEPSLFEDDIVVINTADKKPVDGMVYAVNYEGEAVVKRLTRDAGDWWLTSDNPDQRKHHRKICRGDACIIVGRVVRKESDRI